MTAAHAVEIIYDERYIARPFGIICTCGFKGCAADKEEAERVKEAHERHT